MKYKNLFLAYSIEIIIGFLTLILVTQLGSKAIVFLALLAIRPIILEREKLLPQDEFWFKSFQLGKNALFVISIIIIFLTILLDIVGEYNFIIENKNKILRMIVPMYIFIHGTIGIISLGKRN